MLLRQQCKLLLGYLYLYSPRISAAQTEARPPPPTSTCEHRSVNYIDPVLPQLCHRHIGAPSSPLGGIDELAKSSEPSTTSTTASLSSASPLLGNSPLPPKTFVSFDDWKDQQAREAGQEVQHEELGQEIPIKNSKAEVIDLHDGVPPADNVDSYAASSTAVSGTPPSGDIVDDQSQESVVYNNEKAQHYRSKDAGKTCKERFSYSSFDAGATVLKTNEGAKNAKAILVENKDSYMLLECSAANKFVIVELTDDILIDTVVLANYEFFSSMIRHFRVSASGRYPVKLDKWTSLGTFEAKNSRDIQPFLVPNPLIWAKYVRIEFLSHYGNEYYCPVSLLRVHGTRMLDSWIDTEVSPDDEEADQTLIEEGSTTPGLADPPAQHGNVDNTLIHNGTTPFLTPENPSAAASLLWHWLGMGNDTCGIIQAAEWTRAVSTSASSAPETPSTDSKTSSLVKIPFSESIEASSTALSITTAVTKEASASRTADSQTTLSPPTTPAVIDEERSSRSTSGPESARSPSSHQPSRASSQGVHGAKARNGTSPGPSPPSPTVQESFHKAVSKRLQLLETNVTLSLRYLEDQSRILQDSQHESERNQLARVDSFLDNINRTLMSDLRGIRQQYDQVWQSTVIALESQKEQSQREILALGSRLNILADEVVFQKRMAILQAVLLLCCLLLVVFSRVPVAHGSVMPPLSLAPTPYVRAQAALRGRGRLDRQSEAFSGYYEPHGMFETRQVRPPPNPPSKTPLAYRGDRVHHTYREMTQDGLDAIYEDVPVGDLSEVISYPVSAIAAAPPPAGGSSSRSEVASPQLTIATTIEGKDTPGLPSPALSFSTREMRGESPAPSDTTSTKGRPVAAAAHADDTAME